MLHHVTPPAQHSPCPPPLASVTGSAGGARRWLLPVAVALLCVAFWCWPADVLHVTDAQNGRVYFSLPAPLGQGVCTGYVHSLQRTPVRDYYALAGRRLWPWREYVQSHNAGLPYAAPEYGRFVMRAPWMIVEGGRLALPELLLRVGTETLGRNILLWSDGEKNNCVDLYKKVPGRRLRFAVEREPVWHMRWTDFH